MANNKLFLRQEREVGVEDATKLVEEILAFHNKALLEGSKDIQARFTQYSSPCGTMHRVEMTLCAYK